MIRANWIGVPAMVLMAACAHSPAAVVAPSPTAADSAARADSLARADSIAREAAAGFRQRWSVRPIPTTHAFRAAVARGTRTMDGLPGRAYWQQRVDYRIDAELDPATARLQGEEVVTYRNNSPDTLRAIVFHLYQNVFAEGAQRVRRVPITGGMTIERLEIGGVGARNASGARGTGGPTYAIDGTIMTLALPTPLRPGGSVTMTIAWHFVVPPAGAPRTGHDRKQAYVVAQWYPQVATYDDVGGWHAAPYWSNGEFYLEYGDFEVSLSLPERWLVAGSGVLDNPDEVLHQSVIDRLARVASTDSVIHIVTADDLAGRRVTLAQPGGSLTWRFRASRVRDFAFATSDRYLWDAARAVLPDANGDGREEVVPVNALYRASAPRWRDAARFARHALALHARTWHPFIYPVFTAAEGPINGMEYPGLIFVAEQPSPQSLYAVLAHEAGHQWWSMMVGSNETSYAWQDEGLTTYIEDLAVNEFFPDANAFRETMASYLSIAGTDAERPIMREADLYGPGRQYGIATYDKPATMLHALEGIIGENAVHAALRVYADRWLLKHPTPWDLFHTIEDVAGRKLDWFWNPWFLETATMDQAVKSVDVTQGAAGDSVTIVIEDLGDAPMPVLLAVTSDSGEVKRLTLPVEPWLEGRERQTVTVAVNGRVRRVEIDPDMRFPDADRSNNTWTRQ